MQAIDPVTTSQLLRKDQEALLKLEVFIDPIWKDIDDLVDGKSYLKSISVSHGGAGMSPNPIAAKLSAEISNEGGIFHPKHPTSTYTDYFKAGRKVKISVGAKYGDVDEYWQRIIGYIDMPKFSLGKTFTINIKGLDYTKLLADTVFKKTAVPPDNYWGAVATFDTIASQETLDIEKYILNDAMDIAGDNHNIAGTWGNTNAAFDAVDDTGGGGAEQHVGSLTLTAPQGYTLNENIGTVIAGERYRFSFKYKREAGIGNMLVGLYKTGTTEQMLIVNGTLQSVADPFVEEVHYFIATESCNVRMKIRGGANGSEWRIDRISLKQVTEYFANTSYGLLGACNGIHYVELDYNDDGDWQPVWPGRQKGEGWTYDPLTQRLAFDKEKHIKTGTDNLKVYYYTQQSPENVVADILVTMGLYINQAAALVAMDNPDTGVTIDQVWFKAGSKMLDAIKKICERTDYRFYFTWDGVPVFKPVPDPEFAGDEDLVFRRWNILDPKYYEDRNEIRNRIVIEGLKQALPEGADETMPSELKGEASNAISIDEYGEHTLSINNHLFQDQDSIDAMCITLLTRYEDPKWYFDFKTPFNPAPLEIWDTIKAELMLKGPVWPGGRYGTFRYSSGVLYGGSGTLVNIRGLIRDIKIDKHAIIYKCEEVV